jgi:hypothetical protein
MTNINEIKKRVADNLKVQNGAFNKTSICIFPQFVSLDTPYMLAKLLNALDINAEPYSPWKQYDICICFEDETTSIIDVNEYLSKTSKMWRCDERSGEWKNEQVSRFINLKCSDISKKKVSTIFNSVFGYELDIDPTVYTGKIVQKADRNAAHDGKVINGPITDIEYQVGREEYVYSLHVNNIEGDMVTDIRVPWFGHLSKTVYRKQRPVGNRFSNTNDKVFLESAAEHFSTSEMEKISEFCRTFGLDYGEVDCVRDKDTGKLYVLDVNKTPAGPPNGLPEHLRDEAVVALAVEFAKGYLVK